MNKVPGASFANETHQLLVTVSRHLYISKGGIVKYQGKPMEVGIGNFHRSRKGHLVYYILRDVFSGNFIFAVAITGELLPLLDFLYFGWRRDKEEDHFWGLPQNLSVPKRISSPELITGLQQLKIEPFHPTSGFAAGIRIIRDLEDNLRYYTLGRSAIHFFGTTQGCKSNVYRYMLEDTGKINRVDLWRNNLPSGHPREVPDYQIFKGLFPTLDKEKPMPYRQPLHYAPGNEDEAVIYAGGAGSAWRKSSGALDWLRDTWSVVNDAKRVRVADPNIAGVLQDFLDAQARRLGKSTLRKYELALEMLQACLENYGHPLLEDDEELMLADYQNEIDDEEGFSFSQLFGPEKIPGIINEFLGYFMVRKVSCGKDQIRVTATTIRKLAGWLAAQGYITANEAEEMEATAAQAFRDLPVAAELEEALFDFIENSPPLQGDEELSDLFSVIKVEPGRLHLEGNGEEPVIVVPVTKKISNLCKNDWMLNLLLVKTEKGWRIAESGCVYPL